MALLDPYGTDIAIDATGDLKVTASGALGAVNGPDNCAQAVWLRLKTPLGDLPLHPEYGSRLAGQLIGAKMAPAGLLNQLNAELQNLLASDPRFAAAAVVQSQQPATTGGTDSIQFGVQAKLSGGEQLTLSNTGSPSPSDVTGPQIIDPSVDPTVTYDPLAVQEFFADEPELDTLNNLNSQQWLVENSPTNLGPN